MGVETDIVLNAISNMNQMLQSSLARTEIVPVLKERVDQIKDRLDEHIEDNKQDHLEIFKRIPIVNSEHGNGKHNDKVDIIWDILKIVLSVGAGALIVKLGKL
jgi:hypothetical protein